MAHFGDLIDGHLAEMVAHVPLDAVNHFEGEDAVVFGVGAHGKHRATRCFAPPPRRISLRQLVERKVRDLHRRGRQNRHIERVRDGRAGSVDARDGQVE
jgi:hypothetical protein